MPMHEEIYRSIQESFSMNHTTKKGARTDLKASSFFFAQISLEEILPANGKAPAQKFFVALLGEKE